MELIVGIGEPLIGRFLIYDALRMRFRELRLRKDPDCPVCGTHPTVTDADAGLEGELRFFFVAFRYDPPGAAKTAVHDSAEPFLYGRQS